MVRSPPLVRLLHAIFVVVLLASPALGQKAGPGEKEIAREGPFIIYSDLDLPADKAKKVLERVKAAYDFVGAEQGWAKDAQLAHDLGVRVVSDERMKSIASKAKGVAQRLENRRHSARPAGCRTACRCVHSKHAPA